MATILIFYTFNRTIEELKFFQLLCIIEGLSLLIAPLRNWNLISIDDRNPPFKTFNRTIEELKFYLTFKMSLILRTFNRTIEELKSRLIRIDNRFLDLLIAPLRNWNMTTCSFLFGQYFLLIAPLRNWNNCSKNSMRWWIALLIAPLRNWNSKKRKFLLCRNYF